VTDRQSPDSPRRLDSHWPEILDLVRQKVAQQTFNTWFLPLVPSDEEVNPVESGVMGVTCPNHFFLDWFSEHHLGALNEAGSVYFAGKVGFRLSVAESSLPAGANILGSFPGDALPMDADEAGSSEHKISSPPPSARLGQAIHLNPDYTFDNFVVGSGTDLAFAAATAIARNPGDRFNPLFVHGGVGLGKTHLMHAVGNAVAREWPQKRICYITAETFMNELIGSIRDNRTPEFKLK